MTREMEVGAGGELRFEGEPDATARARRLVRESVVPLDPQLADDAALVVTELVTNALLHAGLPVVVRVAATSKKIRIEVADSSRIPPVPPRPDTEAMTGRGLGMVSRLADRWSFEPTSDGKVVWAELVPGAEHDDEPSGDADSGLDIDGLLERWPDDDLSGEQMGTVRLGDMPTDLLVAAKHHVDNLVREFALVESGAATGATASVPPALARLIETVTTRFADVRQAIKRQALAAAARGEQRTRLELTLPVSIAEAGEAYLAALDESDAYARAARLLTLETPPQHRAFREWYVHSLVTQLRAIARGEEPAEPVTFEQHLLDAYEIVATAERTADRTARLQAVTAALAGATTAEEVADVVVSEGVAALGATGGGLFVPVDDEHLAVPGVVGYNEELVEQLRGERRDAPLPAAAALRTGEAVWLETKQDCENHYPELLNLEPSTVASCALPLFVGDRVLGALRFSFNRQRLFDDVERQFALALAAQTATALERARLLASEREARMRTVFLSDATELLTSSLDAERTLERLTALLVPDFADWAVVYLADQQGDAQLAAFVHGDATLAGDVLRRVRRSGLWPAASPVAEVMASGQSVHHDRLPEALRECVVAGLKPPLAAALAPHTSLVVPLVYGGKPIGALGLARTTEHPYSDDERQVVQELAARAAVAVANAQQYERERETAITLQRSLLPQSLPQVPGVEFAWRYLPGGAGALIGGDWYDVVPLDDGRVAFGIGDVMGRGIRAAAVMGQLRATARAYATAQMSPATVLAQLNIAVTRLEQEQITTVTFGILDPAAGMLTVASAGHLPPLLVPAGGKPRFLPVVPGPPLGVDLTGVDAFAESSYPLDEGSMLLLFTDGLVEDRTRSVDEGMEVLRRAATGATTAETLCARALGAIEQMASHDDDTALLAIARVAE